MKDATADYIAKEEASVRKPVELYKIWSGAAFWYYTNGDVAVDFDGETYDPATISRGSVSYNSEIEISTIKITFAAVADPVVQYIAQNPVAIAWIEVSRLHREQDPLEKSVVFIGQIKAVSFKGVSAEADCVGFEHFLKMPVPLWRYQLTCNHKLFDTRCGITKADYKITATVTLDTTGTVLTSATFGGYDAGYFVGGLVEFEGERRTISAYSGNTITMNFQMINLLSGDSVDVYPGCDGRIETCRDKFDNIDNYLGFPFIPEENPARRMS
jgi:uncharacterized phage protein (TIGR02218 family)